MIKSLILYCFFQFFNSYDNLCYLLIVPTKAGEKREEETEEKEQRRVYSGILNKEEDWVVKGS